LRGWRNWQTR